MARTPYVDKNGLKKGTWTAEEDMRLAAYVAAHGCRNWRRLPKYAGLARCGKSCRLRWLNYLRPDIKRGNFTKKEEETIVALHQSLGNKWSVIATHLPGRTDNEIKNYWNTHMTKKSQSQPNTTEHAEPIVSSSSSDEVDSQPGVDQMIISTSIHSYSHETNVEVVTTPQDDQYYLPAQLPDQMSAESSLSLSSPGSCSPSAISSSSLVPAMDDYESAFSGDFWLRPLELVDHDYDDYTQLGEVYSAGDDPTFGQVYEGDNNDYMLWLHYYSLHNEFMQGFILKPVPIRSEIV